jgi:YidC/Oxa1 family membrane protein insertase
MSEVQPKLKKLQKKYKDDQAKLAQKMMELYKEHKINPLSGFLPILIQFPILIALFKVFIDGFSSEKLSLLYPFVSNPGQINPMFLGLINLAQRSVLLAFLAGLAQFFQSKTMTGQKMGSTQKWMFYFMPVVTVLIGLNLPAGLPLYWMTITLFTIFQQHVYTKYSKNHQRVS